MTREEAIEFLRSPIKCSDKGDERDLREAMDMAIKSLDQEPCEMTAEEYRQRMIQAFHNADTDELIAICVLPTEKEFEHLEWLLKNHYKKEPCEDAISRSGIIAKIEDEYKGYTLSEQYAPQDFINLIEDMPPVTPVEKVGHLIDVDGGVECSGCGHWYPHASIAKRVLKYCNKCGMKLEVPDADSD